MRMIDVLKMLHIAFHLSGLLQISKQSTIYADTVILSSLFALSLWSSSTNCTHHPPLHPLTFLSYPHLTPPIPFFWRPVPLLSQSLLQLGSFPSVSELVTRSQPPSLCVVTAPCLHRHCGWCQNAPWGGHHLLFLWFCLSLALQDAGLQKERHVNLSGDVNSGKKRHNLLWADLWFMRATDYKWPLIILNVFHIKCLKWVNVVF